ncbi:MAG: DUF4368 domain-containing protein [Lachnospiraceae bacterium]
MTPYMINEFIDKSGYERDRKGSVQTTQQIDIYFNFIGSYRMQAELSEEELAKLKEIEAIKDKRHQAYLKRKASGWERRHNEKYEPIRKARMAELKAENPNTYGIPAEEYDKEHYSRRV